MCDERRRTEGDRRVRSWHLDKRVPVALIFMIGLQFMGLIWVAAVEVRRNAEQDRRIENLETVTKEIRHLAETLVRHEVHLSNLDNNLQRVATVLEHHRDNTSKIEGLVDNIQDMIQGK